MKYLLALRIFPFHLIEQTFFLATGHERYVPRQVTFLHKNAVPEYCVAFAFSVVAFSLRILFDVAPQPLQLVL